MKEIQQRISLIQRGLADHRPISLEELLIPRDVDGQIVRALYPPPNVVPREAAALILLYPADDDLWLPLTVRSQHLPDHRGEVSLPGGSIDPSDNGPIGAALRETDEELGVTPTQVTIWGQLNPIYIPPSNFRLTPIVGYSEAPLAFVPNPDEISQVFAVSLTQLLDPTTVTDEVWTLRGLPTRVPFFALGGQKVWGATALVLSELVARLRRVDLSG